MASLLLLVLSLLFTNVPGLFANGKARHVVLVVWDGMRPDFVSQENTPTLHQLAQRGVTFSQHHAVYPSSTEVNGTAILTGAWPARSGLVGNHEYRPKIEPLKSIRTENLEAVRKGDSLSKGQYLRVPTLVEHIRTAGRKTAVAGAKPVALLADRIDRKNLSLGANVYAGTALPASLTEMLEKRLGRFPPEHTNNPTRNDWTTDALLKFQWAEGIPAFSLLWLNEPDSTQHRTGPGSFQSLASMRNSDENLARLLATLESNGVLDKTDVIVVSDHGCSTIDKRVDLAEALRAVGLKAEREFARDPEQGDTLVVGNSGSSFIYVKNHDEQVIAKILQFLRGWEFTGVIFTRKPAPGTFSLKEARLDSEEAPDVVVSLRWTAEKNSYGVPGMITADRSSFGPGQGLHVSLSPYDMRSTLIAAGPDFRSGVFSTLATGNVDVAPTILWLLGVKPGGALDGRVLSEGLVPKGPPIKSFEPRRVEASHMQDGVKWRQYLNTTEVNGVLYLDEGNGSQSRN